MSASNSAAKKRRALIPPNASDLPPSIGGRPFNAMSGPPPPPPQNGRVLNAPPPPPPPQSQQGFTLPQVIALIDKRLVFLEKSVDELNSKPAIPPIAAPAPQQYSPNLQTQTVSSSPSSYDEEITAINEYLDEYNSRFEILTNEIAEIKSIVLKLQTYTMDVNKMLLEEKQSNTYQTSIDENIQYNFQNTVETTENNTQTDTEENQELNG
jgi:hypothetical protein